MPIPSQRQPLRIYLGAGCALLFVAALILSARNPNIEISKTLTRLSGGGGSAQFKCDPHNLPGQLVLPLNFDDYSSAIETHWEPLSESCQSQHFAKQIRDRHSVPRKLHGRTILAIGDSIDRNNAAYGCNLLNGTYTTIQPGHPYWPQDDIPGVWTPNEYSHRSFPAMCHVESIDLLLVNVFHFGLDEEEYFGWKDQYGPPYNTETRVEEIALPLMQKIGRKPDIVELSSGLWDLARFGRQDDGQLTAESTHILRHLSLERLRWFSSRYTSVLTLVASHFPTSQLFSRKLHIAADDSAGEFQQWWQVAGGGSDGNKHTYYFPSWRINEINAAMQDAMDRYNLDAPRRAAKWQMDTWADKIFGAEVYEKGNVHPHHAVTTVWLEQMLYRLYLA